MKPVIEQALKRIDQAVSLINLNRETHVRLAMDIELIKGCLERMTQMEAKELAGKDEKAPETPPNGQTDEKG